MGVNTKKYKALTTVQGNAVLSKFAYVAKESDNIICMFLDAGGEKSRAYPTSTSCVLNQETGEEYPCIWYMVEEEDDTYTIIEFPELIGWRVFSVGGGKSCAITLIKGELFE